jgi:hypothetical protein
VLQVLVMQVAQGTATGEEHVYSSASSTCPKLVSPTMKWAALVSEERHPHPLAAVHVASFSLPLLQVYHLAGCA